MSPDEKAAQGPRQRHRLPNRRRHRIYEYEHDGLTYVAGVGDLPTGSPGEVFYHRIGKPGSAAERIGRDLAVAVSLALQSGVSVTALKHSLERLRDDSGAGPLGKLLDLIAADGGVART